MIDVRLGDGANAVAFKEKGAELVALTEGFLVKRGNGLLVDWELEKPKAWARR